MKRIVLLFIGLLLLAVSIQTMAQKEKRDTIRKEVIEIRKELKKSPMDSVLIQKLSGEQLLELKRQEFEVQKEKIKAESHADNPLEGFQIFLITMLPFLFVISIITIANYAKNKESLRRHEIYMKSLELGQTLPEHFFDEPKKQSSSSNLKKGIILISIGLALVVSYFVIGTKFIMIGGIIPAFIGVGFLLVHFIEKLKSGIDNEQNG